MRGSAVRVVFSIPAVQPLGPLKNVRSPWGSQCPPRPVFVRVEFWGVESTCQEVPVLLHGWGWPVGAGAVELDLRLGGAAWQPDTFSFSSSHLFTYHLQTGQITLCRASGLHIRKHVEGWLPHTMESPLVVLLHLSRPPLS